MKKSLDAYSIRLSLASLHSFPAELQEEGKEVIIDVLEKSPDARALLTEGTQELIEKIIPLSPYVRKQLNRHPDFLLNLLDSGHLSTNLPKEDMWVLASKMLDGVEREEEFLNGLRFFRNLIMTRIAIRDIGGLAPFSVTAREVSDLACVCMEKSLSWLEDFMRPEYGVPQDDSGDRVRLIILGMGKLGARELNFSSDVDVVFAYRQGGQTEGGRRSVSNEEYFLEQSRRLIQILSRNTPEGFVFRVDTRLRPFGDSGPLVMSFDAMCEYYENHGRQWERYALVKASPVAGDIEGGKELLRSLRPFIFKKYIDYSTIESLKEMKAMILAEQAGKAGADNVKLGPGGIRDVEFVVQTFQLIKGGRIKALQVPSLLDALEVIRDLRLLDEETCLALGRAYVFLRATENRLQEYDDQQTQKLPADSRRRQLLAVSLGFEGWEDFFDSFSGHTGYVTKVFQGLFCESTSCDVPSSIKGGDPIQRAKLVWSSPKSEEAQAILQDFGYSLPKDSARLLWDFKESRKVKTLSGQVRELLDRLVPRLIVTASQTENPDRALKASLSLFEAVLKRSIYLVLLYQNPPALENLVFLCSKSRLLAQLLLRQPILLDELVSGETLYRKLNKEELKGLLSATLSALSRKELEHWLDELRRFKKANVLRVAACHLKGIINLPEVSNQLSSVAECILEETFSGAWKDVSPKAPHFLKGVQSQGESGLSVIAYGKLGSREMTYSSDLDLVFLYDQDRFGHLEESQRAQLGYFYSRFIQRLIFFLSTRTSQGILYDIDTRLRPNGSQGILVSSLATFQEYQLERAWTWEHQAIIKARFILGDETSGKSFEEIRASVIRKVRNESELKHEIKEMRNKIVEAHRQTGSGDARFHIKKSPGGLVDIEFMVQFLVLMNAWKHDCLVNFRDICSLIEVLAKVNLLTGEQARTLRQAFLTYQERASLKALDMEEPLVPLEEVDPIRKGVLETWSQILG